ncbi:MAG: hypothetical protein SGARI_006605, partial [Bacillariaceae sp.]
MSSTTLTTNENSPSGANRRPLGVTNKYKQILSPPRVNAFLATRKRRHLVVKPTTQETFNALDSPTKKRHDVGYLCSIFRSFDKELKAAEEDGDPAIPRYLMVRNADFGTEPELVTFDHDGFEWQGSVRIVKERMKISKGVRTNVRKLLLHMPNDGFFYLEEHLFPVKEGKTDMVNGNHMANCPDGWAVLQPE